MLIVDDELLIRWSLCEGLADRGFAVSEASDGGQALRSIGVDKVRPDVVLLDYRLPDSDGLTLLSKIRRLVPKGQVVLMTAYGTPELAEDALALGAYRVIHKPFEVDAMAALIREAHIGRTERVNP